MSFDDNYEIVHIEDDHVVFRRKSNMKHDKNNRYCGCESCLRLTRFKIAANKSQLEYVRALRKELEKK